MSRLRQDRFVALILFCVALLPRIFTLGRAFTTDEAYHWQHRSLAFLDAVSTGRFADTILTGHPGVTTMWLGAFGLLIERALQVVGLLPATVPFETYLTLLRLPLTITTALAVAIGYLLLCRVVGRTPAVIAALLWASDPFLVAHSRVLHLDALVSFLMLLATLALLAACFDQEGSLARPRIWLIVLAGIFTGLALVTKAPAVLLLPIGGLVLLTWTWRQSTVGSRQSAGGAAIMGSWFSVLVVSTLLWATVSLVVAFIAWPALWVAPVQAVERVVHEVVDNGGAPMHWGNFLLGQSAKDPGALYYLVTITGRTTPWTALGLLALVVAVVLRRTDLPRRLPLLLLTCGVVIIIAAVSVTAKKADRYGLPAVPLLLALAGCGLAWLGAQLPTLLRRSGGALVAGAAIVTLTWLHPYYLAYFSPLIGGSSGAPSLVPIGWGEGLDQVADWLNAQPDIGSGAVATWSPPTLEPYLHTKSTWQGDVTSGMVNYLVVYVAQAQSGKEDQYFGKYYPNCAPLHVVRVKGIDYAWIYRVNYRHAEGNVASFGDTMELTGYTALTPDTCTSPNTLALTINLEPRTPPPAPTYVFIHVLGPDGQKAAQLDLPLQNLIPDWHTTNKIEHTLNLPFPTTAAPGTYTVVMGMYRVDTGARIPLGSGNAAPAALDGPDVLKITSFAVGAQAVTSGQAGLAGDK